MKNSLFLFLFLLSFAIVNAQWVQIGSSINGDTAEDTFGETVSINAIGDLVAIGAPINDTAGNEYGLVKVFRFENNNWIQLGPNIFGDMSAQAGEKFGWAIDLSDSGLRLVVGSPFYNDGVSEIPGATKVFEYDGSDWVQLGSTIEGENNQDLSGWSVAINSGGSRIITGSVANSDNGVGSGQARIYEFNGSDWVQLGNDIEGESEYLTAGSGVAINGIGDIVVVGFAENNDPATPAGKGIVRIYELTSNTWQQIGNDLLGDVEGDDFGSEISVNNLGSKVALGARLHSGVEDFSGQIRIFELQNNTWQQLGSPLEGELNEALGTSVDLNREGSIVVAGGRANDPINLQSGIVRIFKYSNNDWEQINDPIFGVANDDRSGKSVGINGLGDKVVMGAPFNDDNGLNSGQARVFFNEAILAIPENELLANISLYPNPNKGVFKLNFSDTYLNINVSIVDSTGKKLYAEVFLNSENIVFNHNLSAGLYFVRVNTEDSEAILKMIID